MWVSVSSASAKAGSSNASFEPGWFVICSKVIQGFLSARKDLHRELKMRTVLR
jgi:hypothetical protein